MLTFAQFGAGRIGAIHAANLAASGQARLRYVVDVNGGWTTYREFRGAELFVPAQPGLTQEWLQRVLSYEIAAGDCNFGVRDARVSVLSDGSGFQVRISGADERAAGEILRHAEQLGR